MLNISSRTAYIGEVMRPDTELLSPNPIEYWYQYDDPQKNIHLQRGLRRLLAFRFKWPDHHALRPSRLWLYRITRRLTGYPRPIIKDPFAAFSSENLAGAFPMDVVCLMRHPAAFVSSIRRAGWRFGFMNFINQPRLMRHWLDPFLPCFKARPHDIIDEAALLWASVYHVLHNYLQRNPHWRLVRHEDLCLAPQHAFQQLYDALHLPFDQNVASRITNYTDSDNPLLPADPHSIKRDTRGLLDAWRDDLDAPEVKRIRQIVEPVSAHYYGDDAW